MKLSPIETMTIIASGKWHTPFLPATREKTGWRQLVMCQQEYRTVSPRTLNSLEAKGLMIQNGTRYILTKKGEEEYAILNQKAERKKIENSK